MTTPTPTLIDSLTHDLTLHIELWGVGVNVMQMLRQYVVSDVESYAVAVPAEGPRWYDVRPMVDLREHAPAFIDMAHHALAVGIALGAITRHSDADRPWLVRVMAF
jgi:hypothetical protein